MPGNDTQASSTTHGENRAAAAPCSEYPVSVAATAAQTVAPQVSMVATNTIAALLTEPTSDLQRKREAYKRAAAARRARRAS